MCAVTCAAAVAAFAAMRTAAFAGCVLSVAMGVRLTFAVVLAAVSLSVPFAMMVLMTFAMPFAVVVRMTVHLAVVMFVLFTCAVRMGAAVLAVRVVVAFAVMRTVRLRRIDERAGEMLGDRLVRRALDARQDADARLAERLDGAGADAAADQRLDLVLLQETGERTVAAALCADDLRRLDGAVLDIVELECLRMAEVLEHRTSFIFIGDCNSHRSFSFLHRGRKAMIVARVATRAAFAAGRGHIAEMVGAALDDERPAVHEALGDLSARRRVDLGDRRARDRHALGAVFLLEPVVIDAADALVLL